MTKWKWFFVVAVFGGLLVADLVIPPRPASAAEWFRSVLPMLIGGGVGGGVGAAAQRRAKQKQALSESRSEATIADVDR